jgi:hypothetical protein
LPSDEPLIDEFRCNSSRTASAAAAAGVGKGSADGRLYVTPFFCCFTEGKGRERIARTCLHEHLATAGPHAPCEHPLRAIVPIVE